MAKKKHPVTENVGFNMTPMIDIVFQLIVFLMLATEFVSKDLEAVKLPYAKHAVEDKNPKDRLIVNICHYLAVGKRDVCKDWEQKQVCIDDRHWKIKIKGKEVGEKELESILRAYADIEKDPEIVAGKRLSKKYVQIRGDRKAPGSFFKTVFMKLMFAKIYKIELGAAKPKE